MTRPGLFTQAALDGFSHRAGAGTEPAQATLAATTLLAEEVVCVGVAHTDLPILT